MLHTCVNELDQHWFRKWLGASSAPSHYLNQCWVIVNLTIRNKLKWNFNQNTKLFISKNASENIVCKMAAILPKGKWVNHVVTRLHCILLKMSYATVPEGNNILNTNKTKLKSRVTPPPISQSISRNSVKGLKFAPSQWETPLPSSAVSHWLGTNLESALQ